MKRFLWILTLVAALAASSCGKQNSGVSSLHPYVAKIVSDTSLAENQLLAKSRVQKDAAIYVCGYPADCRNITEELSSADYFDNIDASPAGDGLADFAGETIVSLIDTQGCLDSDTTSQGFRETCIKLLLGALDPTCYANAYTSEKNAVKPSCKLLVLASPRMETAKNDLDTLLKQFNIDLKVVSAVSESMSCLQSRHPDNATFAVLAAEPDYYRSVCPDVFADTSANTLTELLHCYLKSRVGGHINALLLEDDSSLTRVQRELYALRQGEGIEYESLRSVLGSDFEIVTMGEAVARASYGILRSDGLFTHRALQPYTCSYELTGELVYPEANRWRLVKSRASNKE